MEACISQRADSRLPFGRADTGMYFDRRKEHEEKSIGIDFDRDDGS